MAWAVQARTHGAARRVQHCVEEQPLDPLVVVEVLHVAHVRHSNRGFEPENLSSEV